MTGTTADRAAPSSQVRVLLGTVLFVFLAQQSLNPIIAPLSREVGLAEWQVGVTLSLGAIMMVATSRFWGRRSQSWGHKPVLMAAFALATSMMILFGVLVWLAMRGTVTGPFLFVLFALFRGVGFGTAMAAVLPTAQAYIADVTPDEAQRVKALSGVGAVQGIATVAGAVAGGLLALLGLLAPLIAVPALLALGFVLVATRLHREPSTTLIPRPAHVRLTDGRTWPFLVAGFGLFTALGIVQIIAGFLVQDRLRLDATATGGVTGGALLLCGVGLAIAQGIVVPRSGWRPAGLLRVGSSTALLGLLLLLPDAGVVTLLAALLIVGLGAGIALPGFTAGPTLLVSREEQGALAGLVGAATGLALVVAPTAGTVLYGLWPPTAIIAAALVLANVVVLTPVHPRLRRESRLSCRRPVG